MLERHNELDLVDGSKRNLKRVLRSLAFDDARTWIEGLVLSDIGKLAIGQVEVVLVPLQGGERLGPLTSAGARRAMGSPQGGDPGPQFVRRPAHGHTPENRHTRTQFREIKDLPAHNPHTAGTDVGAAVRTVELRRPL